MNTIIIDLESTFRTKELMHILQDLKSVKRVSVVNKIKDLMAALNRHEALKSAIVKRKNPAIAKYL